MTDKQPAALETKNEQSESKPNTAKRYKTEKAELRRRIVSIVLLLVFVPAVIAVGMLEFNDRYYYITASLIIICSFIPFLMIFEKRRPRARELVVIAVMTALGVAGRAAFYMLPQFKPIAATVIITGVSLGCEAGFITGALTAFVSNMFFGQGPWTPWQMFALGLLGFISGLVFRKDIRTKTQRALLCLYGALSTFFIYGGMAAIASTPRRSACRASLQLSAVLLQATCAMTTSLPPTASMTVSRMVLRSSTLW